uniref:Uncharacterized protein n=1 Tax=Arundo donax TaxID=35708 RepID=A0A0A9AX32_ARUDO
MRRSRATEGTQRVEKMARGMSTRWPSRARRRRRCLVAAG